MRDEIVFIRERFGLICQCRAEKIIDRDLFEKGMPRLLMKESEFRHSSNSLIPTKFS